MKTLTFFLFFTLISNIVAAEQSDYIQIGNFSSGQLEGWNDKSFSGTTEYQIERLDNQQVLKAISQSAASGLFKEQKIDLLKTPFLNWKWRIDSRLGKINEQTKSGDDYSARIYVVISGGWQFWKTKAINYVWASNSAKGKTWPNAFAGNNAMMIAIRSGADKTHTWYKEKLNIIQDMKEQFGVDIRYIDGVAIMTDTDNAKGYAVAYYGDIFFSSE
jgi:hypothetical protein